MSAEPEKKKRVQTVLPTTVKEISGDETTLTPTRSGCHCMNHVSLIGHLASDPEFREAAKGERMALLTVITTGDEPEHGIERSKVSTLCAAFVEFAQNSLRKGSRVHVEGSLQTRY
jgi:hypothetical protein